MAGFLLGAGDRKDLAEVFYGVYYYGLTAGLEQVSEIDLIQVGDMDRVRKYLRILTVTAIIAGTTCATMARDQTALPRIGPGDGRDNFTGPNVNSQGETGPTDYPLSWGLHQTGAINASFSSIGTFGLGFGGYNDVLGWPKANFESPAGGGVEYLYAGAIWVGGIVGNDTLVSVGHDGWHNDRELYPPDYGGGHQRGSVTELPYPGNQAFRSEFSDTIQAGITYPNDWTGRPHIPLPVKLVLRSYSYRSAPVNKVIFYDLIITNVGAQPIEKGYVGFYQDGDVGLRANQNAAQDDLTGSIRNLGIAYLVDNNGDPASTVRFGDSSCTGIFAFKLLGTSFLATDTNYNWWISNGLAYNDFGPRLKLNSRDFGTGGWGTPEGDRNKYFIMSAQEWDYDQVLTATITPDDPDWELPAGHNRVLISCGLDTRFLLSVGPFDLAPDSSARVLFTTFTADSVLTDPNCLRFLSTSNGVYQPFDWLQTLNFSEVIGNAHAADLAVRTLLSPMNPVSGAQAVHRYRDSVIVEWDPYVFDSISGYNVYLSEVPNSALPFPGLVPPWYRPELPTLVDEIGTQHRYVFRNLEPLKSYVCQVAHRYGGGVGSFGEVAVVKPATELSPPVVSDTFCFIRSIGPPSITWSAVSGVVHHYKVYRFADSTAAFARYTPHYSRTLKAITPNQSMVHDGLRYYYYAIQPTAQLPYTDTSFADADAADGNWYAVTAVDSGGYESPFSHIIRVVDARRSADILVMSNANPAIGMVYYDTVRAFYSDVLNGYSYDFFSWVDSTQGVRCPSLAPTCVDWHDFMRYRLIIVDDGLRDQILTSRYEDATGGFAKYLLSGGKLVYCGSFASFRDYPLQPTALPQMYSPGGSFVTRFFGIDSVFFVGYYYYAQHSTVPYVDSLFGFTRAEALYSGAPSIAYDLSRYAFRSTLQSYWPTTTPPSVSTFLVNGRATPLHIYRSQNPAGSINEGQIVGLLTAGPEAETYLFGFHLWYMERAAARQLVDWIVLRVPTSVRTEDAERPATLSLAQNYPNPFNPNTTIRYELPRAGAVQIEVFNILGQRIRRLVDEVTAAGRHSVVWNGRDDRGHAVSSGIYLYRLSSAEGNLVKKMLLVK